MAIDTNAVRAKLVTEFENIANDAALALAMLRNPNHSISERQFEAVRYMVPTSAERIFNAAQLIK